MDERAQIEQAIAALEAQRALLGDAVVNASLAALRERLQKADPVAGQSRRQVTVLFADLSGFTALSEQMDAEDVGVLINSLWRRLDGAISELGGYIDQHAGDAVRAFWGIPHGREDDAARAVRAGLKMQEEIVTFNQRKAVDLRMRIGIGTGAVVFGQMGTQGEFAGVGEPLVESHRLEQLAPPGGVLIDADTRLMVGGLFDLTAYPQAGQAALVQGARARLFQNPTRGVEGVATRMVGREAELKTLQQVFRRVVGQKRLGGGTLLAEAGIGKSRLLHEFERWVDSLPVSPLVLKTRAEEQSIHIPYGVARDLLAAFLNIHENSPLALAHERLESALTTHFGPAGVEKAHFIGHLLGFDFSASDFLAPLRGNVEAIYQRALFYLRQWLVALAEQSVVVIFVDDAHWADDNSLTLFETWMRECADFQILFIFASRPLLLERRPAWGSLAGHVTLRLEALTTEDSRLLVREILRRAPDVPAEVEELILKNAEGNPFYLEELVKMLIEMGVIIKGEREWLVNVASLAHLPIPSTLTGVLQARLDRLKPAEREMIARASVVGRIFWDDALSFMDEKNMVAKPDMDASLEVLTRKEMVFPRAESEFEPAREYIFKHNLLRDVTYEQVLKARKRVYHRLAAEWMIEHGAARVDEFAAVVADHFERAGDASLAAEWYARAAHAARARFALDMAFAYYQKAMQLATDSAAPLWLFGLYEGLGHCWVARSRPELALEMFEKMARLAEAHLDASRLAHAFNQVWVAYSYLNHTQKAVDAALRAEHVARTIQPPDQALLAQTIWQRAIIFYRQNRLAEALQLGEESLALSLQANARPQIASNYNLDGIVRIALGDYRRAIARQEQSLAIWRELHHREFEAALLSNLGESYRLSGEYQRAAEAYEQAIELARQIGHLEFLWGFYINLAAARLGLGQSALALETLEKSLLEPTLIVRLRCEALITKAEILLALDRAAEAARSIQAAFQEMEGTESAEFDGLAFCVLGQVLSVYPFTSEIQFHGRLLPLEASLAFERAELAFGQAGMRRDVAFNQWMHARHLFRSGEPERAETLWQAATEMFQQLDLNAFVDAMTRERPAG